MLPVRGIASRVMESGMIVFVSYLSVAQRPLAQPWLRPYQIVMERRVGNAQ